MPEAPLSARAKTMPPKIEIRHCWLSIRAAAKAGDLNAQALVIALASGHPITLCHPKAPEAPCGQS